MKDDKSVKEAQVTLEVPNFIQKQSSEKISEIQIRSGPLPIPGELRAYENICPGAADRIIQMAEKQGEHRRKQEDKAVSAAVIDGHLGLVFAFIVSVVGMFCGFLLIQAEHSVIGTLFSGISFLSVVKAFLTASDKKKKST